MTRVYSSVCVATLLAFIAALSSTVDAAPTSAVPRSSSSSSSPQHLPISRRSPAYKGLYGDDLVAWANSNTANLRAKYASKLKSSNSKRASSSKRSTVGSATLVNYEYDSTWYASVDIGTPSSSVNLILDTGSSDIWAVQGRNSYDASDSSTFVNSTTAFSITYGSGDVTGTLATDTITLAGHTSSDQTFAIATSVSSGLLDEDLDGIMGFGFKALSTSGATPFWQASGNDLFSFYLQADSDSASSSSGSTSTSGVQSSSSSSSSTGSTYGGVLTLGGTNTSLYQGDINYSDVVDEAYWLITLGGLTIESSSIALSGTSKMAVDTGTTLIGAPTTVVEAIYAEISDSSEITSTDGYYQYPCSTTVNATIHLGDQEYSLSGSDFSAGAVDTSGTYCMGAFFSIGSDESDELQYILGDAFLKHVYTVFNNTASTAQVGFASLAAGLNSSTTSTTSSKVSTASGAMGSHVFSATMMALFVAAATVAILA
jgi:cathepsin D